jgi:hypothetical protein
MPINMLGCQLHCVSSEEVDGATTFDPFPEDWGFEQFHHATLRRDARRGRSNRTILLIRD